MVRGELAGSALWRLLLCGTVGLLRSRFNACAQSAVGRVSAVMLTGFAMSQWAQLVR
jgi:hypothetical protein